MKLPGGNKPQVMIVDDQYRTLQALPGMIAQEAFSPVWVPDVHSAFELLEDKNNDIRIIIIDLKSSGMGGGGFLHQVRQITPHAAVLIVGPLGSFLYQKGGFYELAGLSVKQQINTILLSISRQLNSEGNPEPGVTGCVKMKDRFGAMIGKSRQLNDIYQTIEKLKASTATVLIRGPSGTGKELVARTIHQTSRRHRRPFVAINCGAIPSSLMESEMFGHERGSFTSATYQRKGKFELAEGGTLFLDEIGELDTALQVKLLRVLQEKEFQRVGGTRTLKADVRVIAATSRDLEADMAAGTFRSDLYYRLNVIPIPIPPLRERAVDIPLLLDHFFSQSTEGDECAEPVITERALTALCRYSYPGNVRELTNIVERIRLACPDGSVSFNDLPVELRGASGATRINGSRLRELPQNGVRLEAVEKELILKTLALTKGNKMAAAKKLGITRRRLYLRLSQYDPPPA